MALMTDEIDDLFKVHRLNTQGIQAAEQLAKDFTALLRKVEALAAAPGQPAGRELALVRTKLQEACFNAKRAMAMNPANQER